MPGGGLGKGLFVQESGAFGVETEYDAVKVTGQFFRVVVAQFHINNDFAEDVGGFLGDVFGGAVGAKFVRGVKGVVEFNQIFGGVQFRHREFVADGFHTGEVGLDADGAERGYNQQWRGL